MNKKILYHGSTEIVRTPIYGKGKAYNDYGVGFYCTEHLELAKEWACASLTDGYVNKYELNTEGLKVLNLSSEEYTILHWLALLMKHRGVRISTPVMRRGVEWLFKYFLPETEDFDIITGYRADDSYFSFARAFINNEISLSQLSFAMRLGGLGEQVVLKSEKAFAGVQFISYEIVDNTIYHIKRVRRDEEARKAFFAELAEEDLDGIYMRDIIQREVKADDPCLR